MAVSTMDITRTLQGMCQVRNNEASNGEEEHGKWTMCSCDGKMSARPICEQFHLGHVDGWIEYEFTATAIWDYEDMKYNQFKIDANTVGITSLELRMAGIDFAMKPVKEQGDDGEKNLEAFWSIVKKQLLDLLYQQEQCNNFSKKYSIWVWNKLEPSDIT